MGKNRVLNWSITLFLRVGVSTDAPCLNLCFVDSFAINLLKALEAMIIRSQVLHGNGTASAIAVAEARHLISLVQVLLVAIDHSISRFGQTFVIIYAAEDIAQYHLSFYPVPSSALRTALLSRSQIYASQNAARDLLPSKLMNIRR
jgi:hypothetical protein